MRENILQKRSIFRRLHQNGSCHPDAFDDEIYIYIYLGISVQMLFGYLPVR